MKDLVILIPGITGSVLAKDGDELWGVSRRSAWELLKRAGTSLEDLILAGDDPQALSLDDGVLATGIVRDIHLIPGLWKIDGYSGIPALLQDEFDLTNAGSEPGARNYLEFPYDWRRDNRAAARGLQQFVDLHLPAWRRRSGATDARVILLAHSMGGLVARYWLEVLEGWPLCRALVTFGTPYRGSLNALNYLANGYKAALPGLCDLARSCTSVYQLLARYPAVLDQGELKRVKDTWGLPYVDVAKARDAYAFYEEMDEAVKRHQADPHYGTQGYTLIPIVGTGQKTFQCATFEGAGVVMHRALPDGHDPELNHGDGTVPYVSAIPLEMSADLRESFLPERHGSLQNNVHGLRYLKEFLRRTQLGSLDRYRGPEEEAPGVVGPSARTALQVDLDDLYTEGEPVLLRVATAPPGQPLERVDARFDPVEPPGPARTCSLEQKQDGWETSLDRLAAGLYRVTVRATAPRGAPYPPDVHDIFAVAAGRS